MSDGAWSGLIDQHGGSQDMKKAKDPQRWARLRFAVVGPLLAAPPPPGHLQTALRKLSEQPFSTMARTTKRAFGPSFFGVHQRLALQSKSQRASDLLVMTATPIPRTLALTAYGDMDVTRLIGKPAGRKPIETRVIPMDKLGQIIDGLERATSQSKRAYWVCPLVEESDFIDSTAAEARHAILQKRFGNKVGLVHGRMKGPEKDAVMAAFKSGDISILVSTTVIEVGVDVPEASIMVIENAERFGLAQLHQLRARVGRGTDASSCILLYDGVLGETAASRLKIMRETEDGFIIAEQDLKLRGSGEVLGTRQSGVASFRLADLGQHADLLQAARDDARLILETDPDLEGKRADALRVLLYLFERDDAIKLLSAG